MVQKASARGRGRSGYRTRHRCRVRRGHRVPTPGSAPGSIGSRPRASPSCKQPTRPSAETSSRTAQVELAGFLRDIKGRAAARIDLPRRLRKGRSVDRKIRDFDNRDLAEDAAREAARRVSAFRRTAPGGPALRRRLRSARHRRIRLGSSSATARAALALYAGNPQSPAGAWTLIDPLPDALSEAEKKRVREGCYDLLLILSQAVDPAEGPADPRPGRPAAPGDHGRVPPPPRRLPRPRRRHGGPRPRGSHSSPVQAGDRARLFPDRPRAHRGAASSPTRSVALNTALQLDPDQNAAHLLLAVANFNLAAEGVERGQDQLGRVHPKPIPALQDST